jgi:hypothetical protein
MIFDAHAHKVECQDGGILIALEGKPIFEDTYNNQSLKNFINSVSNNRFLPCYYIDKTFSAVIDNMIVKYHPRREQYTSDAIVDDIQKRKPKLCIIDTLNQPYWNIYDYWKIVAKYPTIPFILAHAGGYDILDFVKMCDFNKNIWLDFSLTQDYFGWCGSKERLNSICDVIDYCLSSSKLMHRILFGSDTPFFSQRDASDKYLSLFNADLLLELNYKRLINSL